MACEISKYQNLPTIFSKGILRSIRERGRIDTYDYININHDENEESRIIQNKFNQEIETVIR